MNFTQPKRFACVAVALIGSAVCARAAAPPAATSIPIAKVRHTGTVDFEKEILPILKNNCLACHNQNKPKGGLVLETPQTILKGGDTGPAAVPRKPKESLLLKAASHQDPDLTMPPPDNKVAAKSLQPEELGLVALWIEQGAQGEVHAAVPIVWQPIPSALSAIYAVALTRDGQFAACGRANQIFVYHVPTGRIAAHLDDPQLRKTSIAGAAHRDTVNSIAFSPDGEWLASGGYREVKLWRRAKPSERFKLQGGSEFLATSADGKWIAAASTNGEIRLLDRMGKVVQTTMSQTGHVASFNFVPGTNLIALARGKSLELVSVPAGKTIGKLILPAEVTAMACLDLSSFAVAGEDNMIRIIGHATNSDMLVVKHEFKSPAPVSLLGAAAASPNGLIAGGPDGVARVWDAAKSNVVLEVKHGSALSALAVRPDGRFFATAGGSVARLWKISDSKMVAEMKGDGRAWWRIGDAERELTFAKSEIDFCKAALKAAETNQVAITARQKKAADTNAALAKIAGEKRLALTNAVTEQRGAEKMLDEVGPEIMALQDALVAAEKEFTNAVALAKAARAGADRDKADRLAAVANTRSNLLAEARAALEEIPEEEKADQKVATEKLAAATKAVTAAEKEFEKADQARSTAEHDLQLTIRSIEKADAVTREAGASLTDAEAKSKEAEKSVATAKEAAAKAERFIRAMAFTPDNLTLFTAGEDAAIHSWDADTGAPFETFSTGTAEIRHLAALDNASVISAGSSSTAAWSFASRWVLERVIGTGDAVSPLADRVNALRFTADGRELFTGGGEPTRGGEIKAWRVKDGALVRDFANVHSDSVFALDLSADGKYLASGAADRFAKVVELSTGKVVKTLEGHSHHVLGVAWKRDGRTLLTAGADNVAKVWDATTGERRKNIELFGKEVTAAAFIGVSDEAVLSSGDGQVLLVKGNGEKVRSFSGATDYVYAVAASADGSVIIGGGADGILRAWNGRDGKLLVEFPRP